MNWHRIDWGGFLTIYSFVLGITALAASFSLIAGGIVYTGIGLFLLGKNIEFNIHCKASPIRNMYGEFSMVDAAINCFMAIFVTIFWPVWMTVAPFMECSGFNDWLNRLSISDDY